MVILQLKDPFELFVKRGIRKCVSSFVDVISKVKRSDQRSIY